MRHAETRVRQALDSIVRHYARETAGLSNEEVLEVLAELVIRLCDENEALVQHLTKRSLERDGVANRCPPPSPSPPVALETLGR